MVVGVNTNIILAPETQANDIKKKEKKKLVSVRTYFGDNEGEVFIMDAKGSGNIGRYLNVRIYLTC